MAGRKAADHDGPAADLPAEAARAHARIGQAPGLSEACLGGAPDAEDGVWPGQGAEDFYPPQSHRIRGLNGKAGRGRLGAQVPQTFAVVEGDARQKGRRNDRSNDSRFSEKVPFNYPPT